MSVISTKATAYWDFRSRTINDLVGALDGNFVSVPYFSRDGLHLDGVDDAIDIGDTSLNIKSVAFLLEAKTTTEDIADFDAGTHTLETSAGTLTATGFATPTLYVDGLVGSTVTTATRFVGATTATGFAADNFDIGKETGFFEGKIKAVVISTDELTASEMSELYGYLERLKFPSKVSVKSKKNLSIPTSESGLIASYDMKLLNNEVKDKKNGYNLTPRSSFVSSNNLYGKALEFNGTSNYLMSAKAPDYEESLTEITIEALIYISSADFNGNLRIIVDTSRGDTGVNKGLFLGLDDRGGGGVDRVNAVKAGFGCVTDGSGAYITDIIGSGGLYHIVAKYNNTTNSTTIYVNGSSAGSTESSSGSGNYVPRDFEFDIGQLSTFNSYFFKNRMVYLNIYDEAKSDAWVLARYNDIDNIGWKTDWAANVSDAAVTSGFLENTPFEVISGGWKISMDTINGQDVKVMEDTAVGSIVLDCSVMGQGETDAAYGEWEFWFKREASGTDTINIMILATESGAFNASGQDGWLVNLGDSNQFYVYEVVNGSITLKGVTANATVPDQWMKLKITRTTAGVFKYYLDDVYLNTFTDATNTTSKYITITTAVATGNKIAYSDISGSHSIVKKIN